MISKKMKLALYVHDFRLEVGHSHSLIELVRQLPEDYLHQFDHIEVIAHQATKLESLFPHFRGTLSFTQVPLGKLKPFMLTAIFYQIWTFIYNRFFQKGPVFRIGIGICCLSIDAVSIQYLHYQWTQAGLALESAFPLRYLYKKLLFWYFEICENWLYSRPDIKLFSPAKFMTDSLKQKFPLAKTQTIYSGVNLNRFEIPKSSRESLAHLLIDKYPSLSSLDLNKPIYLFVGAYERKGIHKTLELLSNSQAQLIVIGSPSLGRPVKWPPDLNVFTIEFSREVPLFYALADCFIFPTLYEPFGLVLFEAMAMGLRIITNRHEVGASELLENLPEIYFADDKNFKLPETKILSREEKISLREERTKKLGDVSWAKASRQLSSFLSQER